MGGRRWPDETENPLGLSDLADRGYLFIPKLAGKKKKEEELIANIYIGRINGGEQPSL